MSDKHDDKTGLKDVNSIDPTISVPHQVDDTDAERRAILAKLGKLAALTPPTVVTLMMTTRPAAAS
jgi:hypothetical protein